MGAAGARRRSAAGAGRASPSAWTRSTARRSRRGALRGADRGARPLDPPRRLLLSPLPRHRRPSRGGDGEVPAAPRPPRDRADDLRLRLGAGRGGRRAHARPPAAARPDRRPRPHPGDVRVRHLLGPPPPPLQAASSPSRWSRPGRRSRVRAAKRLARARELRLRDHDLAAGVGAQGRARAAQARDPLGGRHPRRVELRAASPAVSDRDPAPPRRAPGGAAGSGSPTSSPLSAAPPATTCANRLALDSMLVPNAWDPDLETDVDGRRRERSRRRGAAGPRADLARLHRALRLLRPRPGRARRGAARAGARRARRRRAARAGDRRAGHRGRAGAAGGRRVSRARRPARARCPRERAVALQRAADGLLLLASDRRSQLANLKLFEYLAAARPIVALADGHRGGADRARDRGRRGRAVERPRGDPRRAAQARRRAAQRSRTPARFAPTPIPPPPSAWPTPSRRRSGAGGASHAARALASRATPRGSGSRGRRIGGAAPLAQRQHHADDRHPQRDAEEGEEARGGHARDRRARSPPSRATWAGRRGG